MSEENTGATVADDTVLPEDTSAAPDGAIAPLVDAAAPDAAAAPEAAAEPPKKSPVAQLQGRVGHLTKVAHEKDDVIADLRRQLEARAAAHGAEPSPARSAEAAPDIDRLVTQRAREIAQAERFNEQANTVYDAGKKEFGAGWDESVGTLNSMGLMNVPMVQAAIETGEAAKVLNFLGSDLDEAQRIAALPPAQMGVALTKLAAKLSAGPPAKGVSSAPAPITPLGGSAKPEVDVYDPDLSDEEYYSRRAKQGSPWAAKHGAKAS